MNLRTLISLVRKGQIGVYGALGKASRSYYRVAFIASGLNSGLLRRLAEGPIPLEALVRDYDIDPLMRESLEAWLQVGINLGELRRHETGYALCGNLSRMLTNPTNDAAAALFEELAYLHNKLLTEGPERMQSGHPLTLDDQDAAMIARSSRLMQPFICEAISEVLPPQGAFKLLEIGCGSGAYMTWAALRNPDLVALGIELQEDAAAIARENIAASNLEPRVTVEVGDIRRRRPHTGFDLITLHQNIYYFPVDERVSLLSHVRAFLKTGGRLLLTTMCQGKDPAVAVLNLWGTMTLGAGRLPRPEELVNQLNQAGFVDITARRLESTLNFYSFVGSTPEEDHN